jgi:hypothetical protein
MQSLLSTSASFYKPEVIGTKLQRKLRRMTKTARALLGAELMAGPMQFTPRQASRFVEVEMKFIRAALGATPDEWYALKFGYLSIENLYARQLAARPFSPKKIKKFIAAAGADKILAEIDEMTMPANAAANGHTNINGNGAFNSTSK